MEKTKAGKAYFPRRRTGCLTCKKRHVRCDETRPACTNCLTGGRECAYAAAQVPLRERRKRELRALLPGEQAPWVPGSTSDSSASDTTSGSDTSKEVVSRPISGSTLDPFGTLPIQMDSNMKKIFQHYLVYDPSHQEDRFADLMMKSGGMALQDPAALQSTLLLAGAYYKWNYHGSLESVGQSHLANKITTIRTVNAALVHPCEWRKGQYARLIATLALIECCTGNMDEAETHLLGLASLMNTKRAKSGASPLGQSDANDDELTDRYIILVINFIACVNSRYQPHKKCSCTKPTSLSCKPMWRVHGRDAGRFDIRLTAVRILPAYFLPPASPDEIRRLADVSDMICDMRHANRKAGKSMPGGSPCAGPPVIQPKQDKGAELCVDALGGPMAPYTPQGVKTEEGMLLSSLSGMGAAIELYLGAVLGLINLNWKPVKALIPYTVSIIVRDLRNSTCDMVWWDAGNLDLWFWKVMSGWVALLAVRGREEAMGSPFCWWIRQWSEHTGVRDWEGAVTALKRMAWPDRVAGDLDLETLWDEILAV